MFQVTKGSRREASHKCLDLSGVYPPITTPFDSSGNVSYEKLGQNVARWNALPFRGVVVHGSTGECVLLSQDERLQLVKAVRDLLPSDKLLVVGVGLESTDGTIDLARRSVDAGAQALLVVTPCFYKGRMTADVLTKHFAEVADKCAVPVILYSVPGNTGVDLPAEVAIRLASHPNVVGMKDSGGDITKIGYIVHKTKQHGFQVLAGSAGFLLPALEVGAVGGVCALANVLGAEVCQVYQSHVECNKHEALDLQQRLISPNAGVTKQFGIPGVKAAMEWFSYYGGPVRPPLLPLSDVETALLRKTFEDEGFFLK